MELPTTCWTLLAQATLNGDTAAGEALEQFCRHYRAPVLQLLRRRGIPEARVEDMAHDFFLQLMKASSLKRADPALGRFRQFLGGALSRFLADNVHYHNAKKRGAGALHVSFDAGDGLSSSVASPESHSALLIDQEWALMILGRALDAVASAWEAAGKTSRFAVLRTFLPGALEIISQEDAAARLELSGTALRTELHRLRKEFRQSLRTEVAATVASPNEVDEELSYLREVLTALGGKSASG